MTLKRIVSVDPGQTTGWVEGIYDSETREWDVRDAKEIAWENRFLIGPLLTSPTCFEDVVPPLLPSYVICEQFTLYAHKATDQIGSHFPAVRVIGTLEAFLYEMGILDRLIFQGASVRERTQVMAIHYPFVAASQHKIDAYQHLRYFIVTKLQGG
jgi:hypothetical protein